MRARLLAILLAGILLPLPLAAADPGIVSDAHEWAEGAPDTVIEVLTDPTLKAICVILHPPFIDFICEA